MLWIGAHREKLSTGKGKRSGKTTVCLLSCSVQLWLMRGRGAKKGESVWRQCEGVMADRHISRKLKGKLLGGCVTSACLYGLETIALSEKKQQRCVKITGYGELQEWRKLIEGR